MAAKLSTPTPTWVYTWYEYGWAAHRVPGVTPPFVLNRSDMVTSYKRVAEQVIPPLPSLFTLLRPYLAHFFPVFPRFLRVFTVSTRRF